MPFSQSSIIENSWKTPSHRSRPCESVLHQLQRRFQHVHAEVLQSTVPTGCPTKHPSHFTVLSILPSHVLSTWKLEPAHLLGALTCCLMAERLQHRHPCSVPWAGDALQSCPAPGTTAPWHSSPALLRNATTLSLRASSVEMTSHLETAVQEKLLRLFLSPAVFVPGSATCKEGDLQRHFSVSASEVTSARCSELPLCSSSSARFHCTTLHPLNLASGPQQQSLKCIQVVCISCCPSTSRRSHSQLQLFM